MNRQPIVIAGSGLAGYNTARELRKLDKESPLVLVTGDGGEFYSKPTLSNALAAGKTPEAIPLHSAGQMAEQLGAIVRTRTHVTAIDVSSRTVHAGGEELRYSKLVLAVGARQIRLPLAGDGASAIFSVNSLDDYTGFRAGLRKGGRVAVIGAGLIGCEFANDLAAAGHGVDVIDIAGEPLPRLLPREAGAFLRERLAAAGVVWHLGTSVERIERADGALQASLASRELLSADIVLSAVGLQPQTGLARSAGIAVNRGIIVNRYLETSASDVYALGDCAEVEGLVLPFVMPIMHAARALGATLAGQRTPVVYPAMPVVVKTPACPTVVAPPGIGAMGTWRIEAGEDFMKSLFVGESGCLLGFALNGKAVSERARLARDLPPCLGR
jgi:rubredoxin-NAD+ reductase